MTTTRANAEYLEQLGNTRDVITQADNEGRALRGEFGPERQLLAMSEQYARLKAAGRTDEAKAVKAQGAAIIAALKQEA